MEELARKGKFNKKGNLIQNSYNDNLVESLQLRLKTAKIVLIDKIRG